MRSLEIVERDGRLVRALRVFCPRRRASTDVQTCAECPFLCAVSNAAVVCAPPSALEGPEPGPNSSLFLGPDALAHRTPLGAVCTRRCVAVHVDALIAHGQVLLAREGVVVVLDDENAVCGVLSTAGTAQLRPVPGGSFPTSTAECSKRGRDERVSVLPESAPLSEAIELMVHNHQRLVPVSSGEQRFIGLVTDLDVLRWAAGVRRALPGRPTGGKAQP